MEANDNAIAMVAASRVNDPGGGGNRRGVLFSKQTAALAFGVALLTGCGPQRFDLAMLASGTTAVRVTNNVEAPGKLDRLTISIDGEVLPLAAIPTHGGEGATVAKLRLAAGPHTIAVRAKTRSPGSEVLVVGAQQPFHVGRAPAAITVDVRSTGASFDVGTASPIAVSLAIQGGRMAPLLGASRAEDKDDRCGALLPIPRAICRAAVDLDEATRKNDIVAALCVRDKLDEMRRIAIVGEGGRGEAVAMAEAEVVALSKKVEMCQASYLSPQPDGLRVIPPSRQ